MAIRVNDRSEQRRILRAGLTFSIDPKDKKKEAFSITFPLNVQGGGIPLAVVGVLVAIHFGHPDVTEDVDIVVARDALDRLLDEAPKHGFKVKSRSKVGWHTLAFEDVEINIVPEG